MILHDEECDCVAGQGIGDGWYLTKPIYLDHAPLVHRELREREHFLLHSGVADDDSSRRYFALHWRGQHVMKLSDAPTRPDEADLSVPLHERVPNYATCQGPGDPVCGRARLSTHGCRRVPRV